ncbi:MAG TPA: TldD/PmbA family protein [Anaerolineae bacterium]|nr:TldD/PmbA family protein [Anaerolineae bacterium]
MEQFALNTLELARQPGIEYADVRVVERRREEMSVKNAHPERLITIEDAGIGVRVLVDGAWGFAATGDFSTEAAGETVARAVEIARASARVQAERVTLPPRPPEAGEYSATVEQDAFGVPADERMALLVECCQAMQRRPTVRVAEATLRFVREQKRFVSTEGSRLAQTLVETGGGVAATAVGEGAFQRRSFANHAQAGYEFIRELDLAAQAERCAEEAGALLAAPVCPSGPRTVILGSSMLALQVHESCGHPIELDRVLGTEASFAGTSFMTIEQLGLLQYGSPAISITADATLPRGLGTFGWDDEGTPAESFPVIEEGRFVNYLASRETAWWLAHHTPTVVPKPPLPFSNGTMRADGWARLPLIRMTNISLDPGTWDLEEMIAATDDGLLLDTPKSWSLDDKRLNFHFGCEVAYEIKGGKLGRLLRDASYTDVTPRFWNRCDAVCDERYWQLWGLPSCAKGEPMQIADVAHGAAPARFHGVEVRGG